MLPPLQRKLFRNDGYGPLLKPEIIPFASDLASDDGSVAASTEWVKDLALAPVYLDQSGDDANDGMSAASAVRTFSKAVDIGKSLLQQGIRIVVSGGSYSDLRKDIDHTTVILDLQGAVTFSGDIYLFRNSVLYITGAYTFTATGDYRADAGSCIYADCGSWSHNGSIGGVNSSCLVFYCPVSITSNAKTASLYASNCCSIRCADTISINATDAVYAIMLHSGSSLYLVDTLTITATSVSNSVIDLSFNCSFICSADAQTLSISGSNNYSAIRCNDCSFISIDCGLTISKCISGAESVAIFGGSVFLLAKPSKIYGGPSETITISGNSYVRFSPGVGNSIDLEPSTASTNICVLDSCSSLSVPKGWLKIIGHSGGNACALSLNLNSEANLAGYNVSGSFTVVTSVMRNSFLNIPANANVINLATGTRYQARDAGCIEINGNSAGQGRLPGNSSGGTVESAKFSYYG